MRALHTLLVGFLFLGPLGCGDGSTSPPASNVVAEVRTIVDSSRSTPANGAFAGAPDRALETRIWLSEEPQRHRSACRADRCALVVLAHGYGGSTARFDAIGRRLAKAGYVVAAVRFPLTNEAAPGGFGSGLGDTVEQPSDLSFVIDELITASRNPQDSLLAGRIDPQRIAVLGHSLGGATAIAHSRTACCEDSRVGAVVLVAPVTVLVDALFREPFSHEGPPTLAISGTEDAVVPPEVPHAFYDAIAPPRVHILLSGASHVDLIETAGEAAPPLELTRRAVVAFLDQSLGDGNDLAPELERIRAERHFVRYDLP